MRKDLPQEAKQLLEDRLYETAVSLTNLKSDHSAIIRALMLEEARKGFVADPDGSVRINDDNKDCLLDIHDFLPQEAIRNEKYLVDGKRIPVSPLPDNIAAIPANSDFFKLFTVEHVERTCTCYISSEYNITNSHPLWTDFSIHVPFETTRLPGLSNTCTYAVQEYATNLMNIWSRNIFDYALRRLLLIYFRTAFALSRECNYKSLVARKAQEANTAKKKKQETTSRQSNWQRIRKESRFVEKCITLSQTADDVMEQQKWEYRRQLAEERVEEMRQKLLVSRETHDNDNYDDDIEDAPLVEARRRAETEGRLDRHIATLMKHGVSEADVMELVAKEELASEEDATDEKDAKGDMSAERIRKLVALTKGLLYDQQSVDEVFAACKDDWHDSEDLTDEEIDSILHIWSLLMPYMPPKEAPKCVVLQLPIVLISNMVQRVAGHEAYAREICPYVSPATINAFDVDAAVLYEIMGNTRVGENFTLLDRFNQPISSVKWARSYKEDTLASFLDLDYIKEACKENGILFDHRFTYRPDGSVELHSTLEPDVTPAISFYEQRRKVTRSTGTRKRSKKSLAPSEQRVKDADVRISEAKKLLRNSNAELRKKVEQVKDTNSRRKALPVGDERQHLYAQLQGLKQERNTQQQQSFNFRKKLKAARVEKHHIIYQKVFMTYLGVANLFLTSILNR